MEYVVVTIGQILLAGEKACCKERCSLCPYRLNLPFGATEIKVCLFRIAESFTNSDDYKLFDGMTTLLPIETFHRIDISRAKRRMIFGELNGMLYANENGMYHMVNGEKEYVKAGDHNADTAESSEPVRNDGEQSEEVLSEQSDEEVHD